jgi:hypothetical protein
MDSENIKDIKDIKATENIQDTENIFKNPKSKYILSRDYSKNIEEHINIIKNINNNLKKNNYKNEEYEDVVEYLNYKLQFIRVFSTKGVQGIVGFIKFLDSKSFNVFKISVDINRSIEHEYEILKSLNSLRKFMPNFLTTLGMIEMPITNDFIKNPGRNYPLIPESEMEENCTLPRNVLLLEFVNKLPFYRIIERCKNKNLVSSLILQIILALEIAQNECDFTHYDLHTGNILIQKCDKEALFLYKYKDEFYLLPTFGFFPLIIDTGFSYSKAVNNKSMKTHTNYNNKGFQMTCFDPLNDVHHFLISLFYILEREGDNFDSLSNKIKYIFRHVPVLRKTGWKELPYNPTKIVLKRILEDSTDWFKNEENICYDVFLDNKKDFLEILNSLVELPIKNFNKEYFYDCFPYFIQVLDDLCRDVEYDKIYLFITKIVVDSIIQFKNIRENKNNSEKIVEDFKSSLHKKLKDSNIKIPTNSINYERLLVSGSIMGERLSSNYYKWIGENNNAVKEYYKKTAISCPLDMFIYLAKNFTPYIKLEKDSIIHLFNCDDKNRSVKFCKDLENLDIQKINKLSFLKKGKKLYEILKF